jgi:colanic acid biosynthesis glycosyl transferase WcaI
MRFLILTQYYAPEIGATQVRLGAIARALLDLGHEVEVVTALPNYPAGKIFPQYRGRFCSREEIEGVEVRRVWIYPATGTGIKRLANYLSFVLTSLLALWRCRSPDFLLVDSPPLFLGIPGLMAAGFLRTKMIFNVADLWPDTAREMGVLDNEIIYKLLIYIENMIYDKTFLISAVTDGIREALPKKGVPPDKIIFLPNGVDLKIFKPRPPDSELIHELQLQGKKVILFAGGLGYAQGLDTVLEAAQILSRRREIMFVFIGDGPEKPRLVELAKSRGLENILFLEPAPLQMVARLYSLSVAGLATLRDIPLFEGARPSKILPAMASGVPVLYCGKGEAPRLIENARAGLAIPPENPEALAEGVIKLVDDPGLAKQLGRNGRKFVETNLNWSDLVRTWVEQFS